MGSWDGHCLGGGSLGPTRTAVSWRGWEGIWRNHHPCPFPHRRAEGDHTLQCGPLWLWFLRGMPVRVVGKRCSVTDLCAVVTQFANLWIGGTESPEMTLCW